MTEPAFSAGFSFPFQNILETSHPLHQAIFNKDKVAFSRLKQNRQLLCEQDESGNTPLHLAINEQREEEALELIAAGAELGTCNLHGANSAPRSLLRNSSISQCNDGIAPIAG